MIEGYKNKIINADCLDILKELPPKSIDLVLTDPPYRNSEDNQPTKDMRNNGTIMKIHFNTKDLSGEKYGKLTVVKLLTQRGNGGQLRWQCKCDCGNKHIVTGESLRAGKSKSCGCLKLGRPYNFKDNREIQLWRYLYSTTIIKRAKKHNYKSDINIDNFIRISKMPCIYCGESGVQSTKDRCKSITKNKRLFITDTEIRFNGIDRLDSSKGYFMDNVVSCCKHCNSAKNILTTTEFKNHIIKIYEHYCK